MDIYAAIMQAADHIERHPDRFDFIEVIVPRKSCGRGCAVGWVNHFVARQRPRLLAWLKLAGRPLISPRPFGLARNEAVYRRLDEFSCRWQLDARECASALRAYARKYHAPEKPQHTGIPDSVRSIFTEPQAA